MDDAAAEPARRGAFMDRQIGHLLRRVYARARGNSADALLTLGDVSPVQAAALAALIDGPLSQAELGRRIAMEPANTHTLVRRMAAAGWIAARADPANRRTSVITLTGSGADLAGRLQAVLADAADATLAPLDASERQQLIALLGRIALAGD